MSEKSGWKVAPLAKSTEERRKNQRVTLSIGGQRTLTKSAPSATLVRSRSFVLAADLNVLLLT